MADRVVMAAIGAPHGVRGAVRLTVFAEDPLALRRYNPFEADGGRTLRLTSVRVVGKAIVAGIEGVDDRDAAAALRGLELSVPRSRLPRPGEDEFYHVDLLGLEARLVDGGQLGTVRGVADYGAGDVLEVVGKRGVLLPFTREVVPEVRLDEGYLVVDPPPGLLDEVKEPDRSATDPSDESA
ncbi:ribosome maturation factor RimM [Acuticoccus sp.]|uniref:ribosome maturation factor RimM n=1 Tax=Acuticoccus sp. TaxID=1904378 RepID=UPI003B51F7D2